MISRMHSATVVVADQAKALDFYVNTLGFELAIDQQMGPDMRYLTVTPPGAATQLALGLASWFGPDDSVRSGGNTGIAFVSPDVEETYATLKSRGVRFKAELETFPWGAKATWFYDLDGNEFFLSGE